MCCDRSPSNVLFPSSCAFQQEPCTRRSLYSEGHTSSRLRLTPLASGPHQEQAPPKQQARHDRTEEQGQTQGLTDPSLVLVQRADDLQHAPHVPLLPILAR